MANKEAFRITHAVPSSDPHRGIDFIQSDGAIIPGPTYEEAQAAVRAIGKELRKLNEERRRKEFPFDAKSYYSPMI